MRKINIILFAILISVPLFSQKIQQSFDMGSSGSIEIKSDYPNLVIHSGQEGSLNIEGEAYFVGEPVADAISFVWDKSSGSLLIKSDVEQFENWKSKKGYRKDKEEEENESWKKGNSKYAYWDFDVNLEIYIPSNIGKMKIHSTYGSIKIDELPEESDVFNTYGSIEASGRINLQNCKLEATYSSITLEIPKNLKTNISIRTDYGEIYTDIDFEIDKKRSTNKMYKTIRAGSLNGGGENELQLRADYSNIYLRKRS